MVLRGERNFRRNERFVVNTVALVFGAAIKPNRGFKHKKDVVALFLDLADYLGDAVGLGQRIVDRVAELLHQMFEAFVHWAPFDTDVYLLDGYAGRRVAIIALSGAVSPIPNPIIVQSDDAFNRACPATGP